MMTSTIVKARVPGALNSDTIVQLLRRRVALIVLRIILAHSLAENHYQRSMSRNCLGARTISSPSPPSHQHYNCYARRRGCATPPPLRLCAVVWTLLCLMSIIGSGNQRLGVASAYTLHYVRHVLPSQPPLENDIDGLNQLELYPRIRRNVLIFSKLHRSVWPSPVDGHEEWPKRFVTMDEDWNFDY